jgi:beta-N-acetylhexosaminidase
MGLGALVLAVIAALLAITTLPAATAVAAPPAGEVTLNSCVDSVDTWPIDARLEQLLMVSGDFSDLAASQPEAAAGVGAFVFFGQPAAGSGPAIKSGLAALVAAATGATQVVPWMSTDEEGGTVARLSNVIGTLPTARQMAAMWTTAQVQSALATHGAAMRSLGITMDLAPVLDTASPANTIADENDRSFSENGQVAAAYGLAFAQGLQSSGIVPVVKHFPGLGHASANTDLQPATDPPLSQLQTDDLIPFQSAINAGLPAVMVSHVSVPGLTGTLPASLSLANYQYLRNTLIFNGVAMTDALWAGAISQIGYSVPAATLAAIEAGADMAMIDASDWQNTVHTLEQAVGNGTLSLVAVDASVTRILAAKGVQLCTPPGISTTTSSIAVTTKPGASPASQTLTIQNIGGGQLIWTQTAALPNWLSLSTSSGQVSGGQSVSITVSFGALPSADPTCSTADAQGEQTCTTNLTFTDPNASPSAVTVPVTLVVTAGSKQWYFAEGYTGGNATEYLTLANPNPAVADVSVEYLLGTGSPTIKPYTVGANQRSTVVVNQDVGPNQNVSMVVTADQPIVAERPYYVTYIGSIGHVSSGTDVLGATSLATQFDFANIDTSANHETWLTILNNNPSDMTVTISYFPAAGGSPILIPHTVPANSRGTVFVNGEAGLSHGVYSGLVRLSEPGLVERPLYQTHDSVTGYPGAADVVGVAKPLTTWYFAEGFTSSTVNERYILANPTTTAGTVTATVTLYRSDGSSVPETVMLSSGQQVVVNANAALGTNNVSNSATVTASAPILAERVMSQQYVGFAGCCNAVIHATGLSEVLGAAAPTHLAEFAEGYTGGQVAEYLTIENPSTSQAAHVNVSFLPATGGAPTVETYTIGAHSRFTLYTNSVMPGQWFAMTVLSDRPVVAERPMSFIYNGWAPGSTDVIGYQPPGS